MRRVLGPIFITILLLAFSANLWSGANDYELTPRHGVPAKIFLKGCHKLENIAVDFEGNGEPYQAQWWRCGSANPNWKKGRFPINYVVIQPPRSKTGRTAITLSNAGSSDEYFLEKPEIITLPPGSRQVLLVSGHYYEADQGRASCLLGPVGGEFECWPSQESAKLMEQGSRIHEKSLFRKLDEFLSGQNLPQ